MNSRVYLRVEGSGIDIVEFQKIVQPHLAGSVKCRKHNGSPLVNVPLEYWVSDELQAGDDNPEELILELLRRFENAYGSMCRDSIDLTAVIVAEYAATEDPRGYFFKREITALLGRLGGKLEIDSVPNLRSENELF